MHVFVGKRDFVKQNFSDYKYVKDVRSSTFPSAAQPIVAVPSQRMLVAVYPAAFMGWPYTVKRPARMSHSESGSFEPASFCFVRRAAVVVRRDRHVTRSTTKLAIEELQGLGKICF